MIKKCVMCGREYEAYDKVSKGKKAKIKRRHNSKTCSKKCAREYIHKLNREQYRKKNEI